jgi:hypothetical protein
LERPRISAKFAVPKIPITLWLFVTTANDLL